MPFAAVKHRSLLGLTALVGFGWSVVATAQPAASVAAKPVPPGAAVPPAPAKPPAAAGEKPATAQPAPKKPAAAAATAPAAQPAPGAPAATSGAAQTHPTGSGEPWGGAAPAGQPPNAPGASNPNAPSSPWPDQRASGAAAADQSAPPPVYYVEQPPNPNDPNRGQVPTGANQANPSGTEGDVEPMRLPIEEPPPPPVPRHIAPRTALWLGARLGYFVPFGDLWGRCTSSGISACDNIEGAKFSDVAASGPMFELDLGLRLGRNYVLYLGWERAQLGAADGPSPDASGALRQNHAESDFLAVGVRLSSNPDDIGLLLDLAIGARRFRGVYEGDTQLQLTDAPLESRLGIGADIRTNRWFSFSPMLTLGLGSFGKAEWVRPTTVQSAIPVDSDRLTHGWVTLQLGGHFDVLNAN